MVKLDHTALEQHYGKAYPVLLIADIYHNRQQSSAYKFIQNNTDNDTNSNDDTVLEGVWQTIGKYASSVFKLTIDIIQKLSWPVLLTLSNVPNYLDSMMRVLQQMTTATGETLVNYAIAFLTGAQKMWNDLYTLMQTAGISMLEFPIFEMVQSMTHKLLDLFKTLGEGFASSLRFIFKTIGYVVESFQGFFGQAVGHLAEFARDFGSSILNIPNLVGSGLNALHRKAFYMFVFAFVTVSDFIQYGNDITDIGVKYMSQFSIRAQNLLSVIQTLGERVSTRALLLRAFTLLTETPVIKQVLEWIRESTVVKLFTRIFTFLTDALNRIVMTGMSYMQHFLAKSRVVMSNIVSLLLNTGSDTSNPFEDLKTTKMACEKLSERSDIIPSKYRINLERAVRTYNDFEAQLTFHRKSHIHNRADGNILDHAEVTASLVTDVYFNRNDPNYQPDQQQVEQLFQIRFGMSFGDLIERVSNIQLLLKLRFQEAVLNMDIKTKVEDRLTYTQQSRELPDPVNGLYELAWSKEDREQEIKQLETKLDELNEELRKATSDSKYNNELLYQIELNLRQSQRFQDRQLDPVAFKELQTQHKESIDNLKKIYPVRATRKIYDIEQDIEETRKEIRILKQGGRTKRVAFYVISQIISLLLVGVAGKYILEVSWNTFLRWNRAKVEQDFKPLLEKAKYDPLLTRLVNQYIADGVTQPDTPSLYADFQRYLKNFNYELLHGKIKYDDLYNPDGKYTHMVRALSASLEEHVARKTLKTQVSVNRDKTIVETIIDTFWGVVSSPKKLSEPPKPPGTDVIVPRDVDPTRWAALSYEPANLKTITEQAVRSGLDVSNALSLREANVDQVILKGSRAFGQGTLEDRETFAVQVIIDTYTAYTGALSPLLTTIKDVAISEQQSNRGFLTSMFNTIGFMWEATGASGTAKNFNVDNAIQHMKKGHAPYFAQLLSFYQVGTATILGAIQIGLLILFGISEVFTYIILGERGQAIWRITSLAADTGLAYITLKTELASQLVTMFFSRFTVLATVIGIIIQLVILFYGGAIKAIWKAVTSTIRSTMKDIKELGKFGVNATKRIVMLPVDVYRRGQAWRNSVSTKADQTQEELRKQQQRDIYTRRSNQPRKRVYIGVDQCMVCQQLPVAYQCGECVAQYCSSGCQSLHWDFTINKHSF